jgi:hypothetical protein
VASQKKSPVASERDGRVDVRAEGATDAAAFEVYVEHFLAPTLREGQVVVMDRVSEHTGPRG